MFPCYPLTRSFLFRKTMLFYRLYREKCLSKLLPSSIVNNATEVTNLLSGGYYRRTSISAIFLRSLGNSLWDSPGEVVMQPRLLIGELLAIKNDGKNGYFNSCHTSGRWKDLGWNSFKRGNVATESREKLLFGHMYAHTCMFVHSGT